MVIRYSPLNNLMFASVFQNKETSGPAMLDLLNSILKEVGEEPVAEILDLQSEFPVTAQIVGTKFGRLDVKVRSTTNRMFNFEVQIKKMVMNDRDFFYGGKIIGDEFQKGTPYANMPTVRMINIIDFYIREHDTGALTPALTPLTAVQPNQPNSTLNSTAFVFPTLADIAKQYSNTDEESRELLERLQSRIIERASLMYEDEPITTASRVYKVYNIQMPAFRRRYETLEEVKHDRFLTWLYLFENGYKTDKELKMIATMSAGLENFARQYNIAINDPNLVAIYNIYDEAERDEADRLFMARAEAVQNTRVEDARGFKAQGVDPAIIASVTGLSLDEITRL